MRRVLITVKSFYDCPVVTDWILLFGVFRCEVSDTVTYPSVDTYLSEENGEVSIECPVGVYGTFGSERPSGYLWIKISGQCRSKSYYLNGRQTKDSLFGQKVLLPISISCLVLPLSCTLKIYFPSGRLRYVIRSTSVNAPPRPPQTKFTYTEKRNVLVPVCGYQCFLLSKTFRTHSSSLLS